MAEAGCHDVGHHVRLAHGLDDRVRRMPETEHSVAARVVQDRAFGGDDPGTACGQRDIGLDRIVGVKIDQAGLQGLALIRFIGLDQVGVGRLPALDDAQRVVNGLLQA